MPSQDLLTDRREEGAHPPPLPHQPLPIPVLPAPLPPPLPAAAQGYEAEWGRKSTVYQLAIALILTAAFGAIPAVLDVRDHVRHVASTGVSPWALVLLLTSCLQIAYAVYLAQLPDWSTVWVASLVSLGLATVYAMLLGVFLLADENSQFIQLLGMGNRLEGNRAAAWCLLMLSISCPLAYASGRFSVRWHRGFCLAVQAGAPRTRQ